MTPQGGVGGPVEGKQGALDTADFPERLGERVLPADSVAGSAAQGADGRE